MESVHRCNWMQSVEAWISCSSEGCHLNINRVATEDDLEHNHFLEEVGQTVEHIVLQVRYCPYCGSMLDQGSTRLSPSFRYNDHLKW